MVQFHHLYEVEEQLYNTPLMSASRQTESLLSRLVRNRPSSHTPNSWHAINFQFTFSSLIEELLFQIQMTWFVTLQSDDVRLAWPDKHGCVMTVPKEQTVLEALDLHRPHWHREQDSGFLLLPRPFTDRSQPYVLLMDCKQNLPNTLVQSQR